MTITLESSLSLPLDPSLEAHEPAEVRGRGRDDVKLLVSDGADRVVHATFHDLPTHLRPGDLIVVNTSATVAAAVDGRARDGREVRIHFSTELPGGLWLVEARQPVDGTTVALEDDLTGDVTLDGDGHLTLLERFPASKRLWIAAPHLCGSVVDHVARFGEPIRYRHAPGPWPLSAYQQIFGTEPGSAEMPSASRPFTPELVVDLVRHGVAIAPILLHTGVSSLEGNEMPYPERYRVPAPTANLVNATHAEGGRVVAIGTTVVRALETVVDDRGAVHPGAGWTEVVVTPERGVRAVDGLLTGWHEPEATHLLMLEAIAGRPTLEKAYDEARRGGYLWHEFGDSHLLLPGRQ
jgi:S-adenosylmethionine:tRNA ribosyltransferase-isomerase